MYLKVRNAFTGKTETIQNLSKLTVIEDLREEINKKFEVDPSLQRLFFQGKQMENGQTLFDYSVNVNDTIQLMVRQPLAEVKNPEENGKVEKKSPIKSILEKEAEEKKAKEKEENDVECDEYKIGDLVDIRDAEEGESAGAWWEGKIARIVRTGQDGALTFKIKYDAYDGDDYCATLDNIRPRARVFLKQRELAEDMKVMVNYNVSSPDRRGMWFDAIVCSVRPKLVCTVLAGLDLTPVPDCEILFADEVMRIEKPVPLKDRTEKIEVELAKVVERKHPEKCETCHDNPKKKCKECGCRICGGKDDPDNQIMCDECDGAFHLKCLKLKTMPEEDEWFCPECKNDDDIVKAGEKTKASKKKAIGKEGATKRDWGKGFACAGRTKVSKMDPNHFGPIPGVEVGMNWMFRIQASETGVHRPPVGGIAGSAKLGCPSLVLGGGYEDDVDNGETFTYTGSGGRDLSGNKRTAEQSSDQTLDRTNAALALSCFTKDNKLDDKGSDAGDDWKKGKPIRVLRGYKGAKHSKYAPKEGCRYDGIYKVVKYWKQKGKSGFFVWRYELRRDDPAPTPWSEEGKKLAEEGGYSEIIVPEGHEEAMKAKEEEKALKLGKGGKKRKNEEDIENVAQTDENTKEVKKPKASYKLPADIKKAMQEDKKNERLWKDVMGKEFLNKKALTEHVEELVSCMICMDLCAQPVSTPCLHNICKACLQRSFKAETYTCPSCRYDLGKEYEMEVNEKMKVVLNLLFPGYDIGRA